MPGCPFFRPTLSVGNHVIGGWCAVPVTTRFGLDFYPPSLDLCIEGQHTECLYYAAEVSARRAAKGPEEAIHEAMAEHPGARGLLEHERGGASRRGAHREKVGR
jgi:hypothetical protein